MKLLSHLNSNCLLGVTYEIVGVYNNLTSANFSVSIFDPVEK